MRVVISDFVSLDGVGQAPGGPEEDTEGGFTNGGWSMPFFDAETMGSAINEAMATTSALLFGRRTWQVMAAAWPARAGDPFADRMNEIDKYVVSRTLTQGDLSWENTTLLPGDDLVGAVQRLRSQDGGDVQVMGSLSLARTLISNDLVDEYRLRSSRSSWGWEAAVPRRRAGAYSRTRRHHGQQDGRAHLHLPSRPKDR